jgi:hypothetical protein
MLCQALKNEGVLHFLNPKEPITMNSFDPTRLNFIPEMGFKIAKNRIQKELTGYENEIVAEVQVNTESRN